jgi:adenylosuccinate synthase
MIEHGKVTAIVGGQFGSEAKGLAAAILLSEWGGWGEGINPVKLVCTTNAGAQAGHTTILKDDRKFVCYHLPTIGVLSPRSRIYLNAGSIIDIDLLLTEIKDVSAVTGEDPLFLRSRITIHPNAAVITQEHKDAEKNAGGTTHLASTMKGVGAALANKILRRRGATIGTVENLRGDVASMMGNDNLVRLLEHRFAVTMEIPQGTGLGINNPGIYPTTTSRDCWVGQGLADAGIPPFYLGPVVMVCRTFPIRVGHVYDETGGKVGDSGPFYTDSNELKWEDFPGVEPERTTVTKRIRRIATWSDDQYRDALRLNRPTTVVLTFVNYLRDASELHKMVTSMRVTESKLGLLVNHIYSWGPREDQWSSTQYIAANHIGEVYAGTTRSLS